MTRDDLCDLALIINANIREDDSTNRTWLGHIELIDGNKKEAIIKDLSKKQIANEILSHRICRILGIPTPDIYIAINMGVISDANNMVDAPPEFIGRFEEYQSGHMMFASSFSGSSLLEYLYFNFQFASTQPVFKEAFLKLLDSWEHIWLSVGFDSWIALPDRHEGNIVIDKGEIMLIDHDNAFTGATWEVGDLDTDNKHVNSLFELMMERYDSSRIRHACEKIKFTNNDLQPILLRGMMYLLDEKEISCIFDFIKGRGEKIEILTCSSGEM